MNLIRFNHLRPRRLLTRMSLKVYDSGRATRLWSTSKTHGGMVAFLPQIAFSADGRFDTSHIEVFSGLVGQTRNAKVTENTLTVQDAANGQIIRKVKLETSVHALCFSPDGRRVLINGGDGKTLFYDVAAGTLVHSAHLTPKDFSAFAFSADGQRLFIGDQDGNIFVLPVNDEISSPQ